MTLPGNTTAALDIFRSIDVRKKWINGKVYYVVGNKQYARTHVIPTNPKTLAQQDNRAKFALAVVTWAGLPAEDKATFNDHATILQLKMSGYNLFVRLFMLDEI